MIKFNSSSPPSFCVQDVLTGSRHPLGITNGFFVTLLNGASDRVDNGDYISTDVSGNPIEIIRAAQGTTNQERIALEVGRDLKKAIRQALRNLNLTDAQKADLVNRILAVYVLIDDGDLPAARFMAQNTATGGSFNLARQTALVNLIDQAMTNL